MARPEARRVAGYYPTPPAVVSDIAALVKPPKSITSLSVIDPCAGTGAALVALREAWDGNSSWMRAKVFGCEMEAERAALCAQRLNQQELSKYRPNAIHGDAFQLVKNGGDGASVLYLNPPYDYDPEHRRLEQRWLDRFTAYLAPDGVLLFVVPAKALEASAEYLAAWYRDLRCFRFPDGEFEAFGQVVVQGKRASRALPSEMAAQQVRAWVAAPESLPVLGSSPVAPMPAPAASFGGWEIAELDVQAALARHRPWEHPGMATELSVADLMGRQIGVAVPPRPAHVAMALSAGAFNGRPLEPNDPADPPILAKGVFVREGVQVSQRHNRKGEVIGHMEVEIPVLRVTILRLDDYIFHELAPGIVATGDADPSAWNVADLIERYDVALTELLSSRFPPLHDPTEPGDAVALPKLTRRPYQIQAQAIQAATKLLAIGRNPFLVAEVGTGKSTVALYVAQALSSRYRRRTLAELAELGLPTDRLPVVRRTLILCPPHLLKSWGDQVHAVDPALRVVTVQSAADLEAEGDVYVLSRETAKLGHAWEGIADRCPRCGADVPGKAASNASRRMRCKATRRRALDHRARAAEQIAVMLIPYAPSGSVVDGLCSGRTLRRAIERARAVNEPPAIEGRAADRLMWAVLGAVADDYRCSREDEHYSGTYNLYQITSVARALRREHTAKTFLQALLDDHPPAPAGTPYSHPRGPARWIRDQVQSLSEHFDDYFRPDPADRLAAYADALYSSGEWEESEPCGEFLFGAAPRPRRYPLARMILRNYRDRFDLVILDEAHEFNDPSSAQSKAAHRLSGLPGVPAIVLTGSLMGGYASSLFANLWALSPELREEFERQEISRFADRYGYRKISIDYSDKAPRESERGSHTDRKIGGRRVVGQAPGVAPDLVVRHLLPSAVLMHKEDLDEALPALSELPALIRPEMATDHELLAEYRRLQDTLLAQIKADRFVPERAGRLLGALVELPSYLDRCTDDLGDPYEVRYPESCGGGLIARAKAFPASWRTPKERWLVTEVRRLIAGGERVLVFARHTGGELPARLLAVLADASDRVAFLNARKVGTKKREAWIDEHVIAKDVQVLLVNPNAVRTGLNNLVHFSAGIWHELDFSATAARQANGRLHRIGQTRDVEIQYAVYADTAQEIMLDLVLRKIAASLQVDGLDASAALEAAGASDSQAASMASAMSLGQAVYQRLTGGRP